MEQASLVVKNPPIEQIFWRFPHIGEKIFKNLSYKNLVNCKAVSKSWYHYIIKQKFYLLQCPLHYANLQKNKDKYGRTPLHEAAINGITRKITKQLTTGLLRLFIRLLSEIPQTST